MSIVLALLAAVGYGTGDFLAGLASRRLDFRLVSAVAQSLGLLAALLAVLLYPGDGLTGHVLLWGAIAGVGNGVGALLLYHGLTVGRMSIVAVLSGLTASVLPVLVGVAQGDSISALSAVGVVVAVPAIALVSWQPAGDEGADREAGATEGGPKAGGSAAGSGAIWGFLAGIGFAAFFVGLDRAGTDSETWAMSVNQAVAVLIAGPLAVRVLVARRPQLDRPALALTLGAGIALALATIAVLTAFSSGELAIVVVLTALYPGVTTLLARFVLAEHWVRTQKIGLAAALAAVVMVSVGTA
jgi:drug/metabolite transporter (DMT)-like permease